MMSGRLQLQRRRVDSHAIIGLFFAGRRRPSTSRTRAERTLRRPARVAREAERRAPELVRVGHAARRGWTSRLDAARLAANCELCELCRTGRPRPTRCAATSRTSTRTSRVCSSASTPLAALTRPTRCDARRRRAKRRWTGREAGASSSKSTARRCEPRESSLDVASPSPRSRARFVRRASPRRRRVGARRVGAARCREMSGRWSVRLEMRGVGDSRRGGAVASRVGGGGRGS